MVANTHGIVAHTTATSAAATVSTATARVHRAQRQRSLLQHPSCVILYAVAMVAASRVASAELPVSKQLSKGLSSLNVPSTSSNVSTALATDLPGNSYRLAAIKTSLPVSEHQLTTDFDDGVKQSQDEVDLLDMADRLTSQYNKQRSQRHEKQDEAVNVNLINQLMTILGETGARFDFNDNDLDGAIPFIGVDETVPASADSQSSHTAMSVKDHDTAGDIESSYARNDANTSWSSSPSYHTTSVKVNNVRRQRVERSSASHDLTEKHLLNGVSLTADNMMTAHVARTRTRRDLMYGPSWADDVDYVDEGVWNGDDRHETDDVTDYRMHNKDNGYPDDRRIQTPASMADDYDENDDGGSLAEYLDRLRRRRLRQRKAFQVAVREKQEKILAEAEEHREIEAAQKPSFIPAVYKGVKGFFVPQTSIATVIGNDHAHLYRPRQRKPHHERMIPTPKDSRRTMMLMPSDDGQNDVRRKDVDIVEKDASKSVAVAAARQWANLVRREVRQALDEYDEIYRVSEQLKKAAAANVKPDIIERDDDYWIK